MAINIVEILGTDSVASSRITLNNNYIEIKDKVDPILDSYDTSNGVLNISDLPNGQVIAKRLTITTAGINIQGGALTIGSSSNLIMNGGELQVTTGLSTLGGGAIIGGTGIEITNSKALSESGDFDFLGSTIGNSNLRRTYYIGPSGSNTITLESLSNTVEVILVNDKGNSIELKTNIGDIGNDISANTIGVASQATVLLKFIIPGGSNPSSGKWWVISNSAATISAI